MDRNIDRIVSDFALMSRTANGSGNWLKEGYHYEMRADHLYFRSYEVYALYQQFAKGRRVSAEPIPRISFLQQIKSMPYWVRSGTVRISGQDCRGLQLKVSQMPDHIDVNFIQELN